jgi:hypothetical protein
VKRERLKGREKFQRAYMRVGAKDFERWLKSKENSDRLNEEIHKHLFDLGPATPPRGQGKRTGREEFFFKLSWAFREIVASADTLKDVQFYIGRFPYRKAPISRHRYLQFHVEVFLNEIYILEIRLLNCLAMLGRQYRTDPRLPTIQNLCIQLRELVTIALKKLVGWRGSHVHQYRHCDAHIDRLESIHLYSLHPHRQIRRALQAYYQKEYSKTRRTLREWITSANKSVAQLLDIFFDGVHAITFNKNGTIRYPSRLKF